MRSLSSTLLYLIICFVSLQITAQNPLYADSDVPSDVKIPPAFELSNNLWLASVNQFVLIPLTGKVAVYYIGMFNNNSIEPNSKKNFILPFPKSSTQTSMLSVELEEGVQQIQSTFYLDAPFGNFTWEAGQFSSLPGVTVIALKDSSAKISMESADFIHDTSDSTLNGQQYVRVTWNKDAPYPVFYLTNLIPSRNWTYGFIIFIGFALFAGLGLFVKIKLSRKM